MKKSFKQELAEFAAIGLCGVLFTLLVIAIEIYWNK